MPEATWTPPASDAVIWHPPETDKIVSGSAEPKEEPPATLGGIVGSFERGAAPYAAGAAIGAGIGSVVPGVGTAVGAGAGIAAATLSEFTMGLGRALGIHGLSMRDMTDRVLDAIGVSRPQNWQERAAESVGGFLGGMAGVPTEPVPAKPSGAPQQLMRDFDSQGITPNVPAIGQGRSAALASRVANVLPISGPVIRQGVTKTLGEMAAATGRAAESLGQPGDSFEAGGAIANAMKRFAADKSQAHLDYGRFDAAMAGAPPAPATRTMGLLNELMGKFPNAPELTTWQVRQPIVDLARSLEPRTETIPAKTSQMLDQFGRPTVLQPAQTIQRGGVLSMPEFSELRSKVGYQLEHPSFGPDHIPRGELKRLYAALSKDMESAAASQGPEALKALRHATINYGVRMKLIDRLEPLVSGDRIERAMARLNTAALAGDRGDAGLLRAAKQVMSPQEWGDFGATIAGRLGEPTAGAKDPSGINFSVSSFTTNWNKLSDRAKDMIFGPDVPGSPRASLEAISRIAQAQKNIDKLANVSRSGEYVLTGGLALEAARAAWHAITMGQVGELAGWGAGSAAGYGFAKMLMSPQFARWLYAQPQVRVVTPKMIALSAVNLLNALTAKPSAAAPTAPNFQ